MVPNHATRTADLSITMNVFPSLPLKKKVFIVGSIFLIGLIASTVYYVVKRQQRAQQYAQTYESALNSLQKQREDIPSRVNAPGSDAQQNKQISLYFTEKGNASPLTTFQLRGGETTTILLVADAQQTVLNGFDLTLDTSANISLTNITEGKDAKKFPTEIFRDTGKKRFAKVAISEKNSGVLELAAFTLQARTPGKGTITLSHATITSPDVATALSVILPTVSYTISSP